MYPHKGPDGKVRDRHHIAIDPDTYRRLQDLLNARYYSSLTVGMLNREIVAEVHRKLLIIEDSS